MVIPDWKLIRIGLGSTNEVLCVLQDVLEGLGPVTALGDAMNLLRRGTLPGRVEEREEQTDISKRKQQNKPRSGSESDLCVD